MTSHSVTGSLGGPYLYEAIDPHTGDVLWALEVPGDTLNQFVGDRLYILDQEIPEVSAVCVADGRELWRRALPDIASRVLPAADGVTAVTMPGQLLGVDGSGATVWEAAVTINDETPDVLRVDGRPLIVNATVDGIAVHDASTGQEVASTTTLTGADWQAGRRGRLRPRRRPVARIGSRHAGANVGDRRTARYEPDRDVRRWARDRRRRSDTQRLRRSSWLSSHRHVGDALHRDGWVDVMTLARDADPAIRQR